MSEYDRGLCVLKVSLRHSSPPLPSDLVHRPKRLGLALALMRVVDPWADEKQVERAKQFKTARLDQW